MFRNYFKIASRNILKHKGYSFINLSGLAIGIVVCILILLWVQDELSFDRFHKNADEIYRVVEDQIGSDGNIFKIAYTPWPLGAALVKDYPEVINATRIFSSSQNTFFSYGDKQFYEQDILYADSSFFNIFSVELIDGNKSTCLTAPYSILIEEETVRRYFRDKDPVGELIKMNNQENYTITGVFKKIPANSHFAFNFLMIKMILCRKK